MNAALRYSYANPTEVGPRRPFQLEFWIPRGRKGGEWKPAHAVPVGNYRTWRKVRVGHSHKDKLPHSIATVKSCGYAVGAEKKVQEYLAWAKSAGLTRVTAFEGCRYAPEWAEPAGLELARVPVSEFIGPAPPAETIEE